LPLKTCWPVALLIVIVAVAGLAAESCQVALPLVSAALCSC
jgi:hypothetical protein